MAFCSLHVVKSHAAELLVGPRLSANAEVICLHLSGTGFARAGLLCGSPTFHQATFSHALNVILAHSRRRHQRVPKSRCPIEESGKQEESLLRRADLFLSRFASGCAWISTPACGARKYLEIIHYRRPEGLPPFRMTVWSLRLQFVYFFLDA